MEETPVNDPHEVEWVTVAHTPGIEAASILVGRLRLAGIPARAWEEGARRALPLTVGLLGEAHVAVPAEFVEQAEEILNDELEVEETDEEYEEDEAYEDDEEEDEN